MGRPLEPAAQCADFRRSHDESAAQQPAPYPRSAILSQVRSYISPRPGPPRRRWRGSAATRSPGRAGMPTSAAAKAAATAQAVKRRPGRDQRSRREGEGSPRTAAASSSRAAAPDGSPGTSSPRTGASRTTTSSTGDVVSAHSSKREPGSGPYGRARRTGRRCRRLAGRGQSARRARCSRMLTALSEHPSTVAISALDSPSHATRASISRSRYGRRRTTLVTTESPRPARRHAATRSRTSRRRRRRRPRKCHSDAGHSPAGVGRRRCRPP